MPRSSCSRNCLARTLAAAVFAAPLPAGAALHVYEPFDYSAPSLLNGTPASGLNLQGTYVSNGVHETFQLRVSAPGLSYGNLSGAPSVSGAKLTQLSGSTSNGSVVTLAQPVSILPGQAIFFSALFTFDDSSNGNHFASIDLIDDSSGDSITFGESIVGVRAIRASAETIAAGRRLTTAGSDRAFTNGQTLLLMGRYNNSPAALGDRLELLGYDTAASHALPASFDPSDPNTILYQELDEVDIDLTRISSLRFTLRGSDNNFIDELRIGSTLADVAPIPEPHTWLLMLCGIAGVAAAVRRRAALRQPAVFRCTRPRVIN
jgi:hypothetical protein